MKNTILILTIISTLSLKAQNSVLLNYEWADAPKIHTLTDVETKEDKIYVKHVIASEIFYLDDENAIEYYMEHIIKHLNNEESIDDNNKVYLPGSLADPDKYTIIENARVIKANGKVTELKIDQILEEKNEEDGITYRFFALEGLEPGDEIEYFYVYPRSPRTTGVMHQIQDNALKREATIINVTPKNLINKFKSYNGFPEMLRDSTNEDVNYHSATATNLKALKAEKFAALDANKASVAYYLYKNTGSNSSIDYYSNVSKYLAKSFSDVNPKKTGISKFISKMGMPRGLTEEDKIRFVENYVKKKIRYLSRGLDGLSDLKSITSSNIANEAGLVKLYAAIFDQLEIIYEIVYTTNKYDIDFDQDFKCGTFLDETLLYFPKIDKYTSPTALNFRLGFPPPSYTDNYGYFTRFVDVGGIRSGVGKVKYIDAISADETVDDFIVTLDLTEIPQSTSTMEKKLTGYDAISSQVFYEMSDEEGKKEISEGLVKYLDQDMVIENLKVKNFTSDDAGVKPFIVTADFKSEIFVQKAGTNYLINVGNMIGPQSELYQEEERVLPIMQSNNKTYKRKLIITIPDGYEAANLEQLEMAVVYSEENKNLMGFTSEYAIEGNTLTILCEEYYRRINFPLSKYKEFEKVINAAADFNKIVILLKKK